MRINIVTESKENTWILRRWAEDLVALDEVSIDCPLGADAQYYINYALYDEDHPGVKIAYFTHMEERGQNRDKFIEVMEKCDVAVMMNSKLITFPKKSVVIVPGTDIGVGRKPTIFGVVGKVYASGRKGQYLIQNMVDAGYTVKSWGYGWPCDNVGSGYDGLRKFYKFIDYLLIPSLNEGGPMPVLEAMALNVPVIAPDVGFCWDHPVIRYKKGDWNSLNEVLINLSKPRTTEGWRDDNQKLFSDIERQLKLDIIGKEEGFDFRELRQSLGFGVLYDENTSEEVRVESRHEGVREVSLVFPEERTWPPRRLDSEEPTRFEPFEKAEKVKYKNGTELKGKFFYQIRSTMGITLNGTYYPQGDYWFDKDTYIGVETIDAPFQDQE